MAKTNALEMRLAEMIAAYHADCASCCTFVICETSAGELAVYNEADLEYADDSFKRRWYKASGRNFDLMAGFMDGIGANDFYPYDNDNGGN